MIRERPPSYYLASPRADGGRRQRYRRGRRLDDLLRVALRPPEPGHVDEQEEVRRRHFERRLGPPGWCVLRRAGERTHLR